MEQNKCKVKLPTEEVIQKQISIIVNKGLPTRKSFSATLHDIWHNTSLWHLFFGRGEWLFSLVLLIGSITFTVMTVGEGSIQESEFYRLTFIGAPFLFLALTSFSYIDKKMSGTLEIEMTTKFTVYQLLAIRMFFYSIVASFFIITCFVIAAQFIGIQVLYSIPIALSSLFIFAGLLLYLYREQHVMLRTGLFSAIWIGGNLSLAKWFSNSYALVITQLPFIIYLFIFVSAICLYLFSLKRFFTRHQGGAFGCL